MAGRDRFNVEVRAVGLVGRKSLVGRNVAGDTVKLISGCISNGVETLGHYQT